ncbi:Aste57867_16481 [Aphanomyces stellatus]|uniref:Aste57867_16481 protein n=1 Tax=Aphanomyces stellatus TaxID=120398 RepID=A0A485L8R1_9STRA|nr:hypothetical protein As57867_016424 [Aphanomyces stellatus]VFT93255.1 Aste57867_16481 [Aphanomyces stellatus]
MDNNSSFLSSTVLPSTPQPDVATQAQRIVQYLTDKFSMIQMQAAVGYLLMLALSLGLVLYLRIKRHVAYEGDLMAARHVILPTFEPLLWTLVVALGAYAAFLWVAVGLDYIEWLFDPVAQTAVYAGRQFIFLLLLLYFYQTSVSVQALYRSIAQALALSVTPVAIEAVATWAHASGGLVPYVLQTVFRALLCALYIYMVARPRSRATITSLRAFCIFSLGAQAVALVYNELFRQAATAPALIEPATTMVVVAGYYDAILPLFVWWLLKADTGHWRGLGERACSLQTALVATDVQEITSAQGLHVLIEMHRKHIIDFAYLKVISRVGRGASADVYKGKLHSKFDVAIKVFTPPEINEAVVASFSHETALCGVLDHPNIVQFHGMCVCPPTICLVSELCRGSVHDILATQRLYHTRQHIALDVCMMLDAARAVAYLHSFSPPFIHRDLKPANLMVDHSHVVKVTDFGASTQQQQSSSSSSSGDVEATRVSSAASSSHHRHLTVVGTVEYMAPEVIQGKGGMAVYSEAVDIYSLGITMWDILHPTDDKYGGANHLQIFGKVLAGTRPGLGDHVPLHLRHVIEAAWHHHACSRPSAALLVQWLEAILDDLLAPLADQLSQVVKFATGQKSHDMQLFRGEHLVDCMFDLEVVHTIPEAMRLGNALLDVGLLHHFKHTHAFENSPSLYSFDPAQMDAERPRGLDSRRRPQSLCECSKLAQGFRSTPRCRSASRRMFRLKKIDESPLKLKLLDELTLSQGGVSMGSSRSNV